MSGRAMSFSNTFEKGPVKWGFLFLRSSMRSGLLAVNDIVAVAFEAGNMA